MTGIALSPILSETDHRHFLEHGYVLLRGVVPESAIEEAVAALEASEEARASNPGTQPFFHTQLPEVDEAIPMQAIQRAGLELIGPDHPVNLPQRLVYIPRRLQQDDARLDRWHIDLVYPMLTPDAWAINTFVFLTRVKVGGGAFHFDKGSPRRVRAELLRNGMSTVRGDGKLRIGPGEPVEFLAEPGDILLYSYLMGHTASINTSDPQTRHAFAAGIFQLTDRLVTKDRPVEAMSTAEKASSTRYHRSVDPSLPDYTPAPDAPRSPATGGRLRTHVTLRDQGRIHLLLVEDARPNVVRNFSTTDWSRWDEAPPLVLDTATSITRLDWEHRPEPGLLVSVEEPGGARVRRFRGESFAESRFVELDAVEDAIAAENTYAHPAYGARQAQGDIELRVPASDPTRVEWTCAMETGSPDDGPLDGVSFVVPEGRRILDFIAKPDLPDHRLVVELQDAAGDTEVCWAVSPHLDDFSGASLQPLDGDEPVRCLRLHERSRHYWLASYIGGDGGDEVRWAVIDWAVDARLRRLATREQLADALAIVELI